MQSNSMVRSGALHYFGMVRSRRLTFCLFSGSGTLIAEEGAAIYEVVKEKIEEGRGELTHLEEAVKDQMSGKPKKKRKKKGSPKASGASSASGSNTGSAAFSELFQGLPSDFNIDDISYSDSD
jgi:hypothetical protein